MLEPGQSIPDLEITLQTGASRRLLDGSGHWQVLFFYPKDNTPGCTSENRDFSRLADAFAAAGARLLGVSRDSVKSHQNFCAKQALRHDLAADTESALCDAFGVIQEKSLYGRQYLGIERSTFLVAPDGRVHSVWRKVKVKDHADQVLATLRAAKPSH